MEQLRATGILGGVLQSDARIIKENNKLKAV